MVYIIFTAEDKPALETASIPFEKMANELFVDFRELKKHSGNSEIISLLNKRVSFQKIVFEEVFQELKRVRLKAKSEAEGNFGTA